jgi:hypothetical protein
MITLTSIPVNVRRDFATLNSGHHNVRAQDRESRQHAGRGANRHRWCVHGTDKVAGGS